MVFHVALFCLVQRSNRVAVINDILKRRLTRRGLYKLDSADGFVIDHITKPGIDESNMSATAIISTPTPDRVADVMVPTGIVLDDYRLNPVVLWEHGLAGITFPIAKSEHPNGELAINVFDTHIEGTAYHTNKVQESANIFALLAEKIIRAASIRAGENSKSRMQRTDKGSVAVVEWWPLIEWSWGMVGVNPEAITKTLARGRIGEHRLAGSLRKSLSPYAALPQRNMLQVTSKLKSVMRGKTMVRSPEKIAELKKRISELSPEEVEQERAAADEAGDEELVKMLSGAKSTQGMDSEDYPPEEDNGALGEAPPSARFLSQFHGKLAAFVQEMKSLGNTYENPEAQALVGDILGRMEGDLGTVATTFSGLTSGGAIGGDGKCGEGKCDDDMDHMKSWIRTGRGNPLVAKGHAARLKSLSKKTQLDAADQATLAGIATQLQRVADEGAAERRKSLAAQQAPKPADDIADEILKSQNERSKSLASLGLNNSL